MTRFYLANLLFIIFCLPCVSMQSTDGTTSITNTELTSTNPSSVSTGAWTGSNAQSTASVPMTSMMSSSVMITFPSIPSDSSAASTAVSTATSVSMVSSTVPITSVSTATSASTVTSNVPITSVSPTTNRTLTYRFTLTSNQPLQIGNITNATILSSIDAFVRSSFNLTNGTTIVSVTRAEIQNSAKATATSQLVTDVLVNAAANCADDCLTRTITPVTPTVSPTLQAANGTLITAVASGAPVLVTNPSGVSTTPAPSYPAGEPPPGRAAQLGMGLGISFIAVILIAEIAFLYKKYGCSPSARASDYELRYNHDYEGA